MEGPTRAGPQANLSIDDLPRLDSRLEDDYRDLLESVFIDDHRTADGADSPAWVEIPPDDISLRAAQTLYPPPAPRKRFFNENMAVTTLAVVATITAGTVLFFLARGPSQRATTAARAPGAAAAVEAQAPPASQSPRAVAEPPTTTAPAAGIPPDRASAPSAPPVPAPRALAEKPVPAATTLTVPDRTQTAQAAPAVRNAPPVVTKPPEAPPSTRPSMPSTPPPRRDPNAEAAAQLERPAPAIAPRAQPAAPAPAAPVMATPPVAAATAPAPPALTAPAVTPPVAAPPVAPPPVAVTPPVAAPAPAAAPPPVAPTPATPSVVAAAAPPAASRPAPAATAPPAAVATDEQGVRAIVERYRAAYSALDVNAVRTIWPGVNARALGRAFDQLSTQQLDFAGCEISVTGERAAAGCSGNMEFVPKVGSKTPRLEARTWSFVLRKSGAQWTIEAVESR